jgi:adenylate cyclase
MTAIIFEYDGTLDKFEGDAVMAFWGAPVDQGDHALRACKASLKMLESLAVMREQWKTEGKPPLNIRIGLNTGEVLVGNMGGAGRFDYTVIGDSVNLASRLESANKQYHSRIMLGQKTFVRVAEHVVARELDKLVVVGKTEPVTVYELLGMSENALPPQMQKFLDAYNEGLRLYRERKWEPAIEHFEKARKFKAEDYPSEIYIERARMYQMSPPPDDWNGVFILRSK